MTDLPPSAATAILEPLVRKFWGEPNKVLSSGDLLCFGVNGIRSVDVEAGRWIDYAQDHPTINSGDAVDLVMRERGLERGDAMGWLIEQGYVARAGNGAAPLPPVEEAEEPLRDPAFLGAYESALRTISGAVPEHRAKVFALQAPDALRFGQKAGFSKAEVIDRLDGIGQTFDWPPDERQWIIAAAVEALEAPPKPKVYQTKFKAVWFAGIDADDTAPPVEWLVDDLLTCGDRSMIYGHSRSGKSFAAIDLSMSIARGVPFLGHKVKRGGVVYQAGEGTKGILNRFRAYRRYHGLAPDEAVPLAILRSPINLYQGDQDTNDLIVEIKALAAQMPIPLELVVIDTLATATSGADENSARDMSPVLARVARVSEACQCHVMLVHHMGAKGERPRGHTGVFANIDNALEVSADDLSKIRTMRNTKQKDEAEADEIQFELMRVVIGVREEDQKEISSCVVLAAGEKADARKAGFRLNAGEAVFFRALVNSLLDHGVAPPGELQLPASIRTVVHYDKVKEQYGKLVLSDADPNDPKERDRKRQALTRVRKKLTEFGIVAHYNPWIWWTGRAVQGFAKIGDKLQRSAQIVDLAEHRESLE